MRELFRVFQIKETVKSFLEPNGMVRGAINRIDMGCFLISLIKQSCHGRLASLSVGHTNRMLNFSGVKVLCGDASGI